MGAIRVVAVLGILAACGGNKTEQQPGDDAPSVSITSSPSDRTSLSDATIEFACDASECSFECSLDDAAFAACESPASYSGLGDGAHMFAVRASNAAGTGAAATASWVVDTSGPSVTITNPPASPTNTISGSIGFTCSDTSCTFECSLDGAAFTACTSPTDVASLVDGSHTFAVRAIDGVGNTGAAAMATWTVDTVAPVVQIVSAPAWLTAVTTAQLGLVCSETSCTYECSLDGGTYGACSSPAVFAGLGNGDHTVDVRARDAANNTGSPVRASWTVNTAAPASSVVAVGNGENNTCAIRIDGTLWCTYGANASAIQVGADTSWRTIVSSVDHFCATRTDGTLWCWGDNDDGQLGTGDTTNQSQTPTQVGSSTNWASAAVGRGHSCAVRTDGTLWCWGFNTNGQVGDGTMTMRLIPTQVGSGTSWSSVAAGRDHSCGIQRNGSLWCWGWNPWSQVGDGTTTDRLTPTQVGTATTWASVEGGYGHTCGTRTDGTLWCWGGRAALGDGTSTPRTTPTQIGTLTTWATIVLGDYHTCAIQTDRTLWCWGDATYGAVGNGTATGSLVPQQVGSASWAILGAGSSSTCSGRTDGTLWCWGWNGYGGLGVGARTLASDAQVGTATTWSRVDADQNYACGVRTDGTLWCWGANAYGRLGDGTLLSRSTPTQVGSETDWASVSTSPYHTCARRTNGTIWCWGENAYGELGDSTTTDRLTPTQVGAQTSWASVSAGRSYTCATRTDGTLWCWGQNFYGEVGDGTTVGRTSPTQVGSVTTWASVATSDRKHTCATRTDGTLWCWGYNPRGQLGVGGTTNRTSPTQVGSATTWSTVATGDQHTCATRTDGTLWCWGYNGRRAVGDGTSTDRATPVQIGTATTWSKVDARGYRSGALRTDGTLWLWGERTYASPHTQSYNYTSAPSSSGTAASALAVYGNHVFVVRNDGSLWSSGDGIYGKLGIGDTWSPQQTF